MMRCSFALAWMPSFQVSGPSFSRLDRQRGALDLLPVPEVVAAVNRFAARNPTNIDRGWGCVAADQELVRRGVYLAVSSQPGKQSCGVVERFAVLKEIAPGV